MHIHWSWFAVFINSLNAVNKHSNVFLILAKSSLNFIFAPHYVIWWHHAHFFPRHSSPNAATLRPRGDRPGVVAAIDAAPALPYDGLCAPLVSARRGGGFAQRGQVAPRRPALRLGGGLFLFGPGKKLDEKNVWKLFWGPAWVMGWFKTVFFFSEKIGMRGWISIPRFVEF